MDLRNERYMSALAMEGSMTKAAKLLGISQPALSRWLDRLEEETGCRLVIRSRKRLVLTQSGQIYLEGCQKCLKEASLMQKKLNSLRSVGNTRRRIVVGGSVARGSKAFASFYADFIHTYPDIALDVDFDVNTMLWKKLLHGEVTLAMLGATQTEMREVDFMKFLDEELLLMLPPGHPLGYDYSQLPKNVAYPTLDLRKLQDTPFVVQEKETSYSHLLYQILQQNNLWPNVIFRSNMIPLLYDMVKTGAGAAILPAAYFQPNDGISVFSLTPRMIVYQGIGVRKDCVIDEPIAFVIHRIMNSWGSPYYMHRYADYYLEQRQIRSVVE